MKKIALLLIATSLIFTQCKKNEEDYSPVNITVLNQSIGGPGSSAYNKSYGLNEDGVEISSDVSDLEYYFLSINPASGTKMVEFYANDYNLHFTENSQSKYMKRFEVGDVVANPDAQGNRGNYGVDGIVLEEGTVTNFPLNSISYIGISYESSLEGFKNGWIKIKTDSNYSSLTIISYAVGVDVGKAVKIED
ncbi:hypothetical protein N9544_05735 [Flavobacteriales bacterium]|nr:hypothetical protein [Flavobacteriales bacterium]